MKYKLPTKPDGKTQNLPERISTMSTLDALCPTCGEPTISNTYKAFCYNCGVWWHITRIISNDTD